MPLLFIKRAMDVIYSVQIPLFDSTGYDKDPLPALTDRGAGLENL